MSQPDDVSWEEPQLEETPAPNRIDVPSRRDGEGLYHVTAR
jgi:hypothetical protein